MSSMLQEKENYEELNQIGNGEGDLEQYFVKVYCEQLI